MNDSLKKLALPAVLSALLWAPPMVQAEDSTASESSAATTGKTETFSQGILFPYALLDAALNGNVDEAGNVKYLTLKGNKSLDRFVLATQTADLSKFPVWTVKDDTGKQRTDRSAELVFWINAYNAHLLKTITNAYPINSLDQIKDLFTAKTHVVAGKSYSFRELRDKIIQMDQRAVFALIDGTQGGPRVEQRAFRYTGINQLLEAKAAAFINDPRNVELSRIQNTVRVSEFLKEMDPIFQPLGARGKWGGIRYLLKAYTRQGADKKYFTTSERDYRIEFMPKASALNNKRSN